MTITRKYAGKTPPGRPFTKGNSGRPPGSRNRATVAAEALLDGQAAALTERAIQLALAGDAVALKLCLDRIIAPRKGRPAPIPLPTVDAADGVLAAISQVAEAMSAGSLTVEEGASYVAVLDAARRGIETVELERRLTALEGAKR